MKDLLKKISVSAIILPLLAITLVNTSTTASRAAQDFDAAATYKAKCAMCHGQKAEKKFDPAKTDEALVEATLKGVDTVTPKMPGYEAKGMTADQAKALVTYMRSLRQ
jgi:mono/diheme cytochrome c family protein